MYQKLFSISKFFFLALSLIFTQTSFAKISKGASTTILTAVGAYTTGSTAYPLIAESADSGLSWNALTTVSPFPGIFYASNCSGGGLSAVCLAVGKAQNGGSPDYLPFIAVSNAGATSWSPATLPATFGTGKFSSSTCTGSLCVVTGESNGAPLMLTSFDTGSSWSIAAFGTMSNGNFSGVSCGGGTTQVCTAAGVGINSGTPVPFIVTTQDGGYHWAIQAVSGLVGPTYFGQPGCVGNDSATLCVVPGYQEDPVSGYNIPVIAISKGGSSWAVKTINGLPTPTANSSVTGVSCAQTSGGTPFCTAIANLDGNHAVITSVDGGNTWNVVSISTAPTLGSYYQVSCSAGGSEGKGICVIAGGFVPGSETTPYILQSVDGANTWTVPTISGIPTTDGQFQSATCVGSGTNAICTVAGYTNDSKGAFVPLLAQSTDGGNTWTEQTVTSMPYNTLLMGTGVSS